MEREWKKWFVFDNDEPVAVCASEEAARLEAHVRIGQSLAGRGPYSIGQALIRAKLLELPA